MLIILNQRIVSNQLALIWVFLIFNFPDVKKLVKESVGSTELQQRKLKIQAYSDQTSSALKKHVYANYKQFIETASEIKRKKSIF